MTTPPALLAVVVLSSWFVAAAAPDQAPLPQSDGGIGAPLGGGKPVTTTIIRRCPEGYELVTRANGRRGCAKDIVPPND